MSNIVLDKIFDHISDLKSQGLKVVDSHVHPYDVMGIVHYNHVSNKYVDRDYARPGILESLGYGKFAKVGQRLFFNLFPGEVEKIIKTTYQNVNEKSSLMEMQGSLVDKAVLLPVEPWLTTSYVADNCISDRFYLLGSFDIHGVHINDVEDTFNRYIREYKIVGLKFHPNLQNFKPQPSHNSANIREKLKIIYSLAEKNNVYMLFHSGTSFFTNRIDVAYKDFLRSKNNALLENFCNDNGESELLGKYNVPIVLAHLGHYGVNNIKYDLIKKIASHYENVYFDTSGTPVDLIHHITKIVTADRVIFGSDALYNRMAFNLAFTYTGILRYANDAKVDFEESIVKVLGSNYLNRLINIH